MRLELHKRNCMILKSTTVDHIHPLEPRDRWIMVITALQQQALEPIVPSTVSLTSNPNWPRPSVCPKYLHNRLGVGRVGQRKRQQDACFLGVQVIGDQKTRLLQLRATIGPA